MLILKILMFLGILVVVIVPVYYIRETISNMNGKGAYERTKEITTEKVKTEKEFKDNTSDELFVKEHDNIQRICYDFYNKILSLFYGCSVQTNVEKYAVSLVYNLTDYAVSGNYVHDSKNICKLSITYSPLFAKYHEILSSQQHIYNEIYNGGQLNGYCPGVIKITESSDAIERFVVLFSDFIYYPVCAKDYSIKSIYIDRSDETNTDIAQRIEKLYKLSKEYVSRVKEITKKSTRIFSTFRKEQIVEKKTARKLTYEEILDMNEKLSKEYSDKISGIRSELYRTARIKAEICLKACLVIGILLFIFSTCFLGETVFVEEVYGKYTECFVTDTGECYHNIDCSYLRYSSNSISVYKAEQQGYRSCSRCYVGKLDVSKETNYWYSGTVSFFGSLILMLVIYLVYNSMVNKEADKNYEQVRKKLQREKNEKFSFLDNEEYIRECAGVPETVTYKEDLPYRNNDYIVYVSQYGDCYHTKQTCRGVFMPRKMHVFNCKNRYYPCYYCGRHIEEPEWHQKYTTLLRIKRDAKFL